MENNLIPQAARVFFPLHYFVLILLCISPKKGVFQTPVHSPYGGMFLLLMGQYNYPQVISLHCIPVDEVHTRWTKVACLNHGLDSGLWRKLSRISQWGLAMLVERDQFMMSASRSCRE